MVNLSVILQGIKNDISLSDEERAFTRKISLEYLQWEKNLTQEERRLIRKYTLNSNDNRKPNRFFERLNRAMRGDYTGADKQRLLRYGKIISDAICRHSLQDNIVCYRGVDEDLLGYLNVGAIFSFDQFISTSIVEVGALKKKFKYVIFVPKGARGAYIDNLSVVKGQYEFLLDYKCKYKVTAKNGRTVYLEVII